ncbi:PP2C family protein-serine/threonine phosphatase [Leptothoe sp. PORK10 BA2]|uniref:PP2C family protein-serine/threonine phosphatase n=1 Tax=Leptothoe sp. PORK10 BA2 TaxID=3110254 RepID=UPI002B1F6649|nr:SpoIIE family protein phosphatase [Leptothoe sp. PORK10 BA2]MEA5464820.1 SpoIIE family protein phosphatase [Leptothoe sp. PORK10 BA2]
MDNNTSTILLIDDDLFSRKLLQAMLQKVGCQVVEADGGERGLELYQEISPALILLDAKMPGMDGFECCRKIRQLPDGEHIPILMVTGLEDSTSVEMAFAAGATDYVTKPVQMPILSGRVKYLLKAWQAEKEVRESNERFRLELKRAAEYVEALLPNTEDSRKIKENIQTGIHVNVQYQPSNALGGDAFDYTWLDDEHLMFHLLDVAGHGVKSALLSVSILNILRKQTLQDADFYDPETVLTALNNVFQVSDDGEDYFTFWYGVYNITNRTLKFSSAGHPPAVLAVPEGSDYKTCYLDSDGIAIGLLPEFPFEMRQCEVPEGSSLYLFSDGVYEIPVGDTHEIWGLDAWADTLRGHKEKQSADLQPLLETACRINGGNTLEDDFSVLEVCFA